MFPDDADDGGGGEDTFTDGHGGPLAIEGEGASSTSAASTLMLVLIQHA